MLGPPISNGILEVINLHFSEWYLPGNYDQLGPCRKNLPSLPQKRLASDYTADIWTQITAKAAKMWVHVSALPRLTLTAYLS